MSIKELSKEQENLYQNIRDLEILRDGYKSYLKGVDLEIKLKELDNNETLFNELIKKNSEKMELLLLDEKNKNTPKYKQEQKKIIQDLNNLYNNHFKKIFPDYKEKTNTELKDMYNQKLEDLKQIEIRDKQYEKEQEDKLQTLRIKYLKKFKNNIEPGYLNYSIDYLTHLLRENGLVYSIKKKQRDNLYNVYINLIKDNYKKLDKEDRIINEDLKKRVPY
jgi:hypothetical protein